MLRLPLSIFLVSIQTALADDWMHIETTETDVELSKDLAAIIIEANLQARCDTLLLEASLSCVEDHASHIATKISHKIIPIVLHTYTEEYDTISAGSVGHFQRPSLLVFVCDTANGTTAQTENSQFLKYHGIIQFSSLIRPQGKFIYFRYHSENELTSTDSLDSILLKLAGVVLSVEIQERLPTLASIFNVSSSCLYCNATTTSLGLWRRNHTHFSDLINTVWGKNDFGTFGGYCNFDVGYVDNPPHVFCNTTELGHQDCSGVEWEMILHMSHKMEFGFKLHNFTSDGEQGTVYDENNVTGILGAITRHAINFGIGGHSISEEKKAVVDFTDVYINHPVG